jgi:hypothetical protein
MIPASPTLVSTLPGLRAFWTFQEPAGTPRLALGPHPSPLREGGAPVARADEGIFGPHSADLEAGRWLTCPPAECPALNLHGLAAQVSVVAWIKPRRQDPPWCDFIAGLWDERAMRRQYGLFLGLGLSNVKSNRQVCGHVSVTGGHSVGRTHCDDASSGTTPVPDDLWSMVAMTYDGTAIRSYLNGQLDPHPQRSPYPYSAGIHRGGDDGASAFTVGAVALPDFRLGHPRFDPVTTMGNTFAGLIGGLAVFDRALADTELLALYQSTLAA